MEYNDKCYKENLIDITKDVFYSDASYDSKIAGVRKYSEIIVRRINHADTKIPVMLGQHNIQNVRSVRWSSENDSEPLD